MTSDSLLNTIQETLVQLDTEESSLKLQLNHSQIQTQILNTITTILACSIGFGSYFTGVFGMNLDNTKSIQNQTGSFPIVFVGSFMVIIISFVLTYKHFYQNGVLPTTLGLSSLQKVKKSNKKINSIDNTQDRVTEKAIPRKAFSYVITDTVTTD